MPRTRIESLDRHSHVAARMLFQLIGAASVLGLAGTAMAQYTFTKIDTSGNLMSVYPGNVNNHGEVAFTGFYPGNTSVMYKGSGGPLTAIASTGAQFKFINGPRINCAGEVAARMLTAQKNGIYRGSGSALTVIQSASNGLFDPSIDDDGTCAFYNNSLGILTGSGGATTTIAAFGGAFLGFGTQVDIKDGIVTFMGILANGQSAIYTSNAGVLTQIEVADSQFTDVQGPKIGCSGSVVWMSNTASGDQALRTSINGVTSTFVDTTGPYQRLGFSAGMGINYYNQVAFSAILDSAFGTGIYTGPNPVTDKVIAPGDVLGGRVVGEVYFGGLNDLGQISFGVQFSDQSSGIFRADPLILNPDPGCCTPAPGSVSCLIGTGVLLLRRHRPSQ